MVHFGRLVGSRLFDGNGIVPFILKTIIPSETNERRTIYPSFIWKLVAEIKMVVVVVITVIVIAVVESGRCVAQEFGWSMQPARFVLSRG